MSNRTRNKRNSKNVARKVHCPQNTKGAFFSKYTERLILIANCAQIKIYKKSRKYIRQYIKWLQLWQSIQLIFSWTLKVSKQAKKRLNLSTMSYRCYISQNCVFKRFFICTKLPIVLEHIFCRFFIRLYPVLTNFL